jgi:hypothetical protein
MSKQYLIYDHGSFVGDVGGFLGLLLGHSLRSMYMSARAKGCCKST